MHIEYKQNGRLARPAAANCAALLRACRRAAVGAVALCLSLTAVAVEMEDLYTVEVALDPTSRDAQDLAFRTALSQVLVRVTGTTAIVESEQMSTLFPNPARYVSQYRPGPDDTLVVSLEGAAVESVLRSSGASVWGSDRPLTLVWIGIDRGLGDREIVAAGDQDRLSDDVALLDHNRLLRERIEDVATYRGIPVMFPLLDSEDLENIAFGDLWGGFDDPVLRASLRYQAESVLVGRIRPDTDAEDRWTWYHAGGRAAWSGETEAVVHQLADALAAQYALTGREPVNTIRLTISGINSVTAFGKVEQLMAGLRGVDSVSTDGVEGDKIIYEVQVLGGMERLQRTLSGSNLLEAVATYDAAGYPQQPGMRARTLEFLYRAD